MHTHKVRRREGDGEEEKNGNLYYSAPEILAYICIHFPWWF